MSEKGSVSTYRRIVKSTGLFGGVQVIGIICSCNLILHRCNGYRWYGFMDNDSGNGYAGT